MEKSLDKADDDGIKSEVMDIDNHVIIAGFGRVGRMVAKMLSAEQVNYIAVDIDSTVVEKARSEGFPIFKKNISLASTLELIAVSRARAIVLSMQNEVTIRKSIKVINENFPDVTIVARVPDFSDSKSYKKLGAHKLVPETYETGLQIGAEVLRSIGFGSFAISSLKERFRAGDYAIPKSVTSNEE
jgi:CPA2 family monovalent cation:H+ antiporter-2